MPKKKLRFIDIVQDNYNPSLQHVIPLHRRDKPIGDFYLYSEASSSQNAELIQRIGQAYDDYFAEIIKSR